MFITFKNSWSLRFFLFLTVLFLFFLFNSSVTYSHGSGVSYEEIKDGFKIDIGHDEFISAEESTRFDLALLPENPSSVEGEIYTDVWVTFTKDNKIFFAGGINKPIFGTTGFTYVFPKEGVYTVSARFQNRGETITKTEFPLIIIAPHDQAEPLKPFLFPIIFAIIGCMIGVVSAVVIQKFLVKK